MLNSKKDAINAMLLMNDKNNTGHQSNYKENSRIMLIGGENFKNYCNNIKLKGKKALIPCGSADQSLELIRRGFDEIEIFDVNRLAKYILNIKKAAILSLTYEEYLKFIASLFEDVSITTKIYSLLDEETKEFLNILMANNSNYALRSSLFTHTRVSTEAFKYYKNNFSIYNEKSYYIIKKRLLNVEINYREMDIYNPYLLTNYDFIYFSNILLFSSKKELNDFVDSILPIYFRHLNETGILGLHYAHLYSDEPVVGYSYTNKDVETHKKNIEIFSSIYGYNTVYSSMEPSGFGSGLGKKDKVLSLIK